MDMHYEALAARSFTGSWGSTPNCATCFAPRARDRFRTLWTQCSQVQMPGGKRWQKLRPSPGGGPVLWSLAHLQTL